MKSEHELIAQGVAGTLLAQVQRVLMHATDPAAAVIRLAVSRVQPAISPSAPVGQIDEGAFFGALASAHGEDFATAARDGDPASAAPQASTDVTSLQQQVAELQRQLAQVLDQRSAPPAEGG